MTVRCEIIQGDCLDVLSSINRSPRLIFADPPYNIGIDYGDGSASDQLPIAEYRHWVEQWITACSDILTDDGSLWVMMPHEHQAVAFTAMENEGLHWRNTIVWYETFGLYCKRKFSRTSRLIHYFTKDARQFVFNDDSIRVPSDRQLKYNDRRANPKGKIPGDVWQISRVCGTYDERIKDFPTQLPLDLLRRIVAVASKPGDLVLDPFSGSATTGVAAVESDRNYIGIELNSGYCDMARKRLGEHAPLFLGAS